MTHHNQSAPRLKDVANRAGVSYQTVWRVVKDHPDVDRTTREKVKAALSELSYRGNNAARNLVTQRSHTIGIMGTELYQYGPVTTALGAERAARAAGYRVSVIAPHEPTKQAFLDAARHFQDQGVDGIIVTAPHLAALDVLSGLSQRIPVVIAGALGDSTMAGVTVDQSTGAELAVKHLISQGHHRIGHLAGPQDCTDGITRAKGWRTAVRSAGMNDEFLVAGNWSAASGYIIGRKLALDCAATAYFVANDQMALGLLRAFKEARLRVPQDVSVVGFDDQPEAAYFTPPLTTVRLDFNELGRRCSEVIVDLINNRESSGRGTLSAELVLRKSTAHAPEATNFTAETYQA